MSDPIKDFENERQQDIRSMAGDKRLEELSSEWMIASSKYKYGYNFKWLGRPIIQMPTDIVALQELIWEVKPDLIIETGIAHGGSIIFYASMMELLGTDGQVIGIDIDIRKHNRNEIEKHPMMKRIKMIEGSSIDIGIAAQVRKHAEGRKKIMVVLDSCHTHEHVLEELKIYSEFVTTGSYIVVFDTIIEFFPDEFYTERPWKKGNNPWTAVQEFIKGNEKFVIDRSIPEKLIFTSAPDGFLKKVK